tara:strand:- start:427 stop:894 length:468 start_codon:yes stop_codon:yes gene_type:complete
MNTSVANIHTDYYFNTSSFSNKSFVNTKIVNFISESNKRAIETLKSYAALDNNWDGYEALKPSNISIKKAISFILTLQEYNIDVYFVAPTPDGDILVETKSFDANLEFEFSSNSPDIIIASQDGELKSETELNDTTLVSYLRWLICPNGDCPPNL